MLLKNALELSKSINEDRRIMHETVQNKGMSDPEVRKISQQLDRKISMLQKMMNEMDVLPRESSL
ncbi:aspartyl-phosphate phosphatase Spo0E family protein [Neobacillus cucumis]|uniref:aspartyl-phosphate phosphatase Spo0E family protein n=1 Tax=Neobacillus cucumis TaxID=1740721 RepID=UPI0018DF0996|nr:aspartyl-phosphate phosphatase Spo0E family protein [Neobacillus cucumis]MBI0580009.1 aspartyl-phosphate phosphatase Spo0E family protein [Neobacillus cucumis]